MIEFADKCGSCKFYNDRPRSKYKSIGDCSKHHCCFTGVKRSQLKRKQYINRLTDLSLYEMRV